MEQGHLRERFLPKLFSFLGLIFVFCLCFSNINSPLNAASYTWDGGAITDNWSDGNNWEPDAPAGGPGSGDDVLIDSGTANVSITGPVSVNTIVLTSGADLELGASLTVASDCIVNAASQLRCNASGVSTGNLTNAGTITSSGAAITCANFRTTGTFTATGATTINTNGDVYISGTFTHNNSTTLNLSGDHSLTTLLALNSIAIISGKTTLSNLLNLTGSLAVNSGAILDIGANNITASAAVSGNSATLTNVNCNISCSDFTSTGAFYVSGTTKVSTTGNVSISGTFSHGNVTSIYMSGTKNLAASAELYELYLRPGTITATTGT